MRSGSVGSNLNSLLFTSVTDDEEEDDDNNVETDMIEFKVEE